ncbi:MAG: hypothetical protein HYV77_00660 [Candidatus Wildermuthbacteria bacterium]|nr:hypothetical protein [Candidatus Wildermuthbacteria bacterium]
MKNQLFSDNPDTLVIWKMLSSTAQALINSGTAVLIGLLQKEGQTEPIELYLLACPTCHFLVVDYPHGFERNRHFWCEYCKASIYASQRKVQNLFSPQIAQRLAASP